MLPCLLKFHTAASAGEERVKEAKKGLLKAGRGRVKGMRGEMAVREGLSVGVM